MRASADIRNSPKTLLLLLLLLAGGFVFRSVFAVSVMPPPSRMQGETTQALRYTSMISAGEGIPAVDSLVMRPQGMTTAENSIFEEYIAGGLHRITGGDLNTFLLVFCRLFPLLLMPVLYFWMSGVGYSRIESLFGTSLYAVILPALLRTRGESLYRETVALPLIILALMLIDRARLGDGRKALSYSIAGAAALFLSLAAWKVTGFLSAGLFLWMLLSGQKKATVLPVVAAQLAASLFLSHMKHDGALLSPATILAVFAALGAFIKSVWIKWTGVLFACFSPFLLSSTATGHVGSVILAKLHHFFSHPEDPTSLSDDARLFWVSGYTSPSPGQILLLFGPVVVAAIAGWKEFRSRRGVKGSILSWFPPVALAGYLFFDRLHVLLAAAVVPVVISSSRGRKLLLPVVLLVFGTQSMFAPELAGIVADAGFEIESSSSLLSDPEVDQLIHWGERNQGTVLSFWHLSGLMSAYSETPVVTHTFFENSGNRETIVRFAELIYSSETEMVEFMQEKGAQHLIYQADFIFDRSPQGLLYLAGYTEVPDGSLAIRLHYYPESLERLVPVWQNESLRIFTIDGESCTMERHALWERRYGAFLNTWEMAYSSVMAPIDTGLFLANSGMGTANSDRISAGLLLLSRRSDEVPAEASVELLQNLLMAYLSGEYDIDYLADDFETYLDAWGPDPELRVDLIRLLRGEGMHARAEMHMAVLESLGGV